MPVLALLLAMQSAAAPLPARYFQLIEGWLRPVEEHLAADSAPDLTALQQRRGWRHFPSAMLGAAVLHARQHRDNPRYRDPKMRDLAVRIGDLVTEASEKGQYDAWPDNHRDTYMWLDAYRLLERDLDGVRRARWREQLERYITKLAEETALRQDFALYNSPFIRTSPNHYALWASTTHLAGRIFGNKAWEELGARVMHRFAAEEQSPDGYWGEHNNSGPTPGYNYLTLAAVALYYEHSRDPAALTALRRSTDFHKYFTYPDGTPVDVINDRNRHWTVSDWAHFGFSHFPDGRRYAEFLTGFKSEDSLNLETLGRIAQNALYYHDGATARIPQDEQRAAHQMSVPAGIRKTGPWVVCLSGLISTQAVDSQFYLDRQGHLSVFHEKLGLIITGANSKRQPELATFRERHIGQLFHLPMSSRLQMRDRADRLSLSYHTFFADLDVAEPEPARAAFLFSITGKGRPPEEAYLTLQLVLKAGELLETAGASRRLGTDRIELTAEELGGSLRHRGWTLKFDAPARLTWPVYPFNPYANAPETSIDYAVGALTIPLRLAGGASVRPNEQRIRVVLEAQ